MARNLNESAQLIGKKKGLKELQSGYQNLPSSQCQGHNHRAPGSPCHSALRLPGCHKSVLSVCNCISKCNTHFLPCGDIFIPVFKAGSSAVTQCSKGEALLVPKSVAAKDSSRTRCCRCHSRASESQLPFPPSPANHFTEHCLKYNCRLFHLWIIPLVCHLWEGDFSTGKLNWEVSAGSPTLVRKVNHSLLINSSFQLFNCLSVAFTTRVKQTLTVPSRARDKCWTCYMRKG